MNVKEMRQLEKDNPAQLPGNVGKSQTSLNAFMHQKLEHEKKTVKFYKQKADDLQEEMERLKETLNTKNLELLQNESKTNLSMSRYNQNLEDKKALIENIKEMFQIENDEEIPQKMVDVREDMETLRGCKSELERLHLRLNEAQEREQQLLQQATNQSTLGFKDNLLEVKEKELSGLRNDIN